MSANDDKRIQSIDCKEEYAFEASENILPGHEKTINVKKELKSTKMSSFDDVTEENRKESSPKWPHIFDYPYRITIMGGGEGGSGSGQTNTLLHLTNHQPDMDKFVLYA